MRVPLAVLVVVLLASFAGQVDGFVPHSLQSPRTLSSTAFLPRATPVKDGLRTDTKDESGSMTEEEEAILFGGSSIDDRKAFDYPRSGGGGFMPPNELDMASDPLINKLRSVRDNLSSCPQIWREVSKICPDKRALFDEHLCDEKLDISFSQMNEIVKKSATVFADLGVKKGSNVAILGENSAKWLMIDHGIQLAGGASAVRGADAPVDELHYIYEHSDSAGVAVLQGPKLLAKLAKHANANGLDNLGLHNESHGPVKTIILMHREKKSDADIAKMAEENGVEVFVFSDLLDKAKPIDDSRLPKLGKNDLATIVYTSGTTGNPKGVMLSHGNLIHQMSHRITPGAKYEDGEPLPGETMVSLLPVWHITERAFELWMASRGCNVVYSSIRSFKNDMAKHKPEWMVLVPRVLEKIALGVQDKFSSGSVVVKTLVKLFTATSSISAKNKKIANGIVVGDEKPDMLKRIASKAIVTALAPLNAVGNKLVWSKVQDGFGGQLKVLISGGSALAGSLEEFYETVGMNVCVGYGLTECSPLISFRRSDSNLVTAGCAGLPCHATELRIVDPAAKAGEKERPSLPPGEAGVVIARGPQVMQGYYKNPEATTKAVDKFGWFDTGDLGRINPATGDLILTGRAKDTIVLSNGENIEPVPIEDAVFAQSSLIEQVMLTGQDGRRLVAIAVLRPDELANAGFLGKSEAKKLQDASDKINDPKCTEEEYAETSNLLVQATQKLQSDSSLNTRLIADCKAATSSGNFRAWEQVGAIYYTLEPFAMINGLLTQSFKVKRQQVMEKYGDALPK